MIQKNLKGNGTVKAAGAFNHVHTRHRPLTDRATRWDLYRRALHGMPLHQRDHLHTDANCGQNFVGREHPYRLHGEHDIGCREAVFISQWVHAFAHSQQAHDTSVILACGTASGASCRGIQLCIQVTATLQRLDDGVGGGGCESAVLRRGAQLSFCDAVIELDGVFRCHGDGLTIEHLQLNVPASGGLDDFIFVNLIARFDFSHLAVRTDSKGFAGDCDDGCNFGHGVSPECVCECDVFRLGRPPGFGYWT